MNIISNLLYYEVFVWLITKSNKYYIISSVIIIINIRECE